MGLNCCPLYDYIQAQKHNNPQINVRDLQIPMETIESTYAFFDEKVADYNNRYNNANKDFSK